MAEPAPDSVPPAPLRCPRPGDLVGKRWWAFGFPVGNPWGSAADGQVDSALSYRSVRLAKRSSFPIERGFSGGGLWSPDYQAVVGIVSHADTRQGGGLAITLHWADQCFPGQNLRTLAERYKASSSPPPTKRRPASSPSRTRR